MHIMIFDTETTSLDKPFCYDVGYVITNTDTWELVKKAHYVVEQNWHNLPLFESAYYKEKRPLYIQLMRQHKATMKKWGYIMQDISRDIRQYNIQEVYAYNSQFDDTVFQFNCEWFHCINPLETIPVIDVWGYASSFITCRTDYQQFCEEHEYFTDSGNYKSSAEVVYRFLKQDPNFVEAHMGLYDAEIEFEILKCAINIYGAALSQNYKVKKILPRLCYKPFIIKIDNKIIYQGEYIKKISRNDTYNFITN